MMFTWSAAAIIGSALTVSLALVSPTQGGPPAGQQVDGISCDAMEGQRVHIHQHIAIFDHGKPVAVPNNVGRPLMRQCLYWIHTHTPDGIIHIESPITRVFTLGDFFIIWGKTLTTTQIAGAKADKGTKLKVWVDGKPYTDDPRTVPLGDHTDIVIQAGPPFSTPTKFTAWNGAQ